MHHPVVVKCQVAWLQLKLVATPEIRSLLVVAMKVFNANFCIGEASPSGCCNSDLTSDDDSDNLRELLKWTVVT